MRAYGARDGRSFRRAQSVGEKRCLSLRVLVGDNSAYNGRVDKVFNLSKMKVSCPERRSTRDSQLNVDGSVTVRLWSPT